MAILEIIPEKLLSELFLDFFVGCLFCSQFVFQSLHFPRTPGGYASQCFSGYSLLPWSSKGCMM